MEEHARDVSQRIGSAYLLRGRRSLQDISKEAPAGLLYLIRRAKRRDGTHEVRHEICDGSGDRLYTNPRMWRLIAGTREQPLMRAISPADQTPPRRVVDATAGLGGTALRIAHACGAQCRVAAVEVSAPIACQLDYGLRRLAAQQEEWSDPATRIDVVNADAAKFLEANAPNNAERSGVDVVYLNPCMDISRPTKEDTFLHRLASLEPIAQDVFEAAVACAACRVVLRHPKGYALPFGLAESSITRILGGRSDFLVVAT